MECPEVPLGINFGYAPQAKFAFPRSYVLDILVSDWTGTYTMVDNVITVDFPDHIGHKNVYVVNPKFLAWSSNRYTLDFVVCDAWNQENPDDTPNPSGYQTRYGVDVLTGRPYVEIRNPFIVTQHATFALPQAPGGYWYPP